MIYKLKIGKEKYLYYILGLIFIVFIFFEFNKTGDFHIFLESAQSLLKSENIYQKTYGAGLHYFYSPLFALMFSLFTFFLNVFICSLWKLLNIFFLYRIWKIFKLHFDIQRFSPKKYNLFVIFSFVSVMSLIYFNFHNIRILNLYIFLLYSLVEGLYFIIDKNRKIAGALLIALAINFKILPIVIIPYLLYRNQIKSSFYILFFSLILLLLPSIFLGSEYNLFLLNEWWVLINPANKQHILDVGERGLHGLSTLIPTLFMEGVGNEYSLTLKRNILDLNYEQVSWILNIARFILISYTFFFLRTLPFKPAKSQLHKFWELSYIFAITPLIFPHQQKYAFFFIFPSATYLIYFIIYQYNTKFQFFSKLKFKFILVILLLIFFLFNLELILGHFREIYWHYKTITYGTLLLLIPLSICNPLYLNNKKQP